jgi:hypothetical protein
MDRTPVAENATEDTIAATADGFRRPDPANVALLEIAALAAGLNDPAPVHVTGEAAITAPTKLATPWPENAALADAMA